MNTEFKRHKWEMEKLGGAGNRSYMFACRICGIHIAKPKITSVSRSDLYKWKIDPNCVKEKHDIVRKITES